MRIISNKVGECALQERQPKRSVMRNLIKVTTVAGVLVLSSLSLSAPAAARDVSGFFSSSGFGIQIGNTQGGRSYYGNPSYYGTPYRNYANGYSPSNYGYGSNYGYRPNYGYGSASNYGYAPYAAYGNRSSTRGGGRARWGGGHY